MPTCRRKRVVLAEPSPALLEALKKDPSRDVFYLERTGELFETYESVPHHVSAPLSRSQRLSRLSEHPVPTLLGCHFTGRSSSSARLPARVVLTTSRRWIARSLRLARCIPGFLNLLRHRFSKPYSGVSAHYQWNSTLIAGKADFVLEVIGRLDHLIEAVYERFKDRYFLDESELLWFGSCAVSDCSLKGCSSTFKERGSSNLSHT